ncbi:MAG: SHOCT domain-containing protein [Oscillospiraceae bacterium]|nr:SHOCT domain-containing protein [Oscillospiraceae bacterium]
MENSIIKADIKFKFSMVYKIIMCIFIIATILWIIPIKEKHYYGCKYNVFDVCIRDLERRMYSHEEMFIKNAIPIVITMIMILFLVITMYKVSKCFLKLTAEGIEGSVKKLFSTESLRLPIAKVDSLFVKNSIFDKIRGGKTLVIRSTSGTIRFKCVQNADEFVAAANKAIEENKKANRTAPVAPAPVVQFASSADELKKFKDLLDSGVITQEEFDAKKKQILGL